MTSDTRSLAHANGTANTTLYLHLNIADRFFMESKKRSEDKLQDQMTMREFTDPFTGSK